MYDIAKLTSSEEDFIYECLAQDYEYEDIHKFLKDNK
jgi:hypothetical protein